MELLFRFLIGGIVVSLFASLGDGFKPKTFAGLMSAAPSVALATLGLAVWKSGISFAAVEAKSMIVGALAFLIYAYVVGFLMMRKKWPVLPTTALGLLIWFAVSFGAHQMLVG